MFAYSSAIGISSVDSPAVSGRSNNSSADAGTLEFSPCVRGGQQSYLGSGLSFDLSRVSERVRINMCGQIFETSYHNIKKYPDTLLGNFEKGKKYFDASRNEFYFDRNREAFDCIFFFYQSGGKLLKPQNMSPEEFLDELRFYQMGSDVIEKYIETYCPHKKPRDPRIQDRERRMRLAQMGLKEKLWEIFNKPDHSMASRVVAGVSVCMIVLSIIVLCVESEYYFTEAPFNSTATGNYNITVMYQKEIIPGKRKRTEERLQSLFVAESLAMTWFTIEFFVRFFTCPSKSKFLRSVLNIFDFLAVLPFYSVLLMEYNVLKKINSVKARPLSMLRISRLVRIFPILKLTRHSKNLQILGHTFKSSLNELGLLIFFFSMSVVLFSSAVYIAEQDYRPQEGEWNEFRSIPAGFWWAIITMSTVGYGDMIPQTVAGKIVGSACALVGILTLSLPVPIIVSNFTYYYQSEGAKSSASEADFGNIADTIQRYSMMGPTVTPRQKKSSTAVSVNSKANGSVAGGGAIAG
ncbi:shaker-related potassium channel tsha2-like isoform X3 [Convolutriloba macropyga]|uniref:shaker-related potassium channel tsha2-like isoform X3 n=1 Tax=Convolutriloba macropyga TaxID=536237 RepID=UPI003F51DCF3